MGLLLKNICFKETNKNDGTIKKFVELMFRLKDLNILLTTYLEGEDLLHLNQTNRYFYQLLDDKFYSKRHWEKYGGLPSLIRKNITRQQYYETEKYLHHSDSHQSVYFAISTDNVELLFLIYYFKTSVRLENTYIKPGNRYPSELAIEKNSLECFKFLTKNKPIYINYMDIAISYDSEKIVEYLYSIGNGHPDARHICSCFLFKCCKYLELCQLDDETVETVFDLLSYSPDGLETKMIENYNKPFSIFIRKLSTEQLGEIKNMALQRNRFQIIKLITVYTSPFSGFSGNSIV